MEEYKINNPEYRMKMASFDYDWTLVNPESDSTLPKDINDWEWYYHTIPEKLKGLYNDGYMIVIFTNQSKSWRIQQIKNVLESLNIPCFIIIGKSKDYKKPSIELYKAFIGKHTIDKDKSFFVGDALGRKIDFANSDAEFAKNIGIKYYSPEEYFDIHYELDTKTKSRVKDIIKSSNINNPSKQCLIIMMGYPGSGKSSIVDYIKNECPRFKILSGDKLKTTGKIKKTVSKNLESGNSIIIDATNSSENKRKEYLDLAIKFNISTDNIYIIEQNIKMNLAFKRNRTRNPEQQIPKIAYNVYRKYYVKPRKDNVNYKYYKVNDS